MASYANHEISVGQEVSGLCSTLNGSAALAPIDTNKSWDVSQAPSTQYPEISSYNQNYGISPSVTLIFADSKWFVELIRMIHTMSRRMEICFTRDTITVSLYTTTTESPFLSVATINAKKTQYYCYDIKHANQANAYTGLSFNTEDFYRVVISNARHAPLEMNFYAAYNNFSIQHISGNMQNPESTRFVQILDRNTFIPTFPFSDDDEPNFCFNSNNISEIFSLAIRNKGVVVQMYIYEDGITMVAFDNLNRVILLSEADFLPEGTYGTIIFAEKKKPAGRVLKHQINFTSAAAKALSKINKITPDGANVGVYVRENLYSAVFFSIDFGSIGRVKLALASPEEQNGQHRHITN